MSFLNPKLHRTTEKAFKLKKNSLKQPFEDLKVRHGYNDEKILQTVKECVKYCEFNGTKTNIDFLIAFNYYVSCLNNPKKVETGGTVQ
jgi:NAD(P)H-nitrite reductase large subunit